MASDKFKIGIHNAVQVCMNVSPEDKVLVISDQPTQEIGQALIQESESIGAQAKLIKLEDMGKRPMIQVPDQLLDIIQAFLPTVTFYAADSLEGEVTMRMALNREIRELYTALGTPLPRHGHMVGISEQLVEEGLTADYLQVSALTNKIFELVKEAKTIQVSSLKGSEITAVFNPDYRWVPCHGLYHKAGDWGNLPEGEVFTCPWKLDGMLVADVLGDFFSLKYGVLEHPLTIEVHDSLVTQVSCKDSSLAEEFLNYLDSAENGRRAGEFAIGTNTAIKQLSGNLLQDEKIPGIHVAFGNPIGYETGADWKSDIHVDVVPTGCTIKVDDQLLMRDGLFLPEFLI